MRAHFGLPSVEKDELEGKPPVTVKFEIPYFTVSGIQVCLCVPIAAVYLYHIYMQYQSNTSYYSNNPYYRVFVQLL